MILYLSCRWPWISANSDNHVFSLQRFLECAPSSAIIILMLKTHKQRPQVFLLSWYSSLKIPVYKIPWKTVPPQVLSGQARRSQKRTHPAPSWLSCLCLSIGVAILWSHKNHCWSAVVGELRPTFSLEREGRGPPPQAPVAFVFIWRTRRKLFTERRMIANFLLKSLTSRAWPRHRPITDPRNLEMWNLRRVLILLCSFCPTWRRPRRALEKKESCAFMALPLGTSKDLFPLWSHYVLE